MTRLDSFFPRGPRPLAPANAICRGPTPHRSAWPSQLRFAALLLFTLAPSAALAQTESAEDLHNDLRELRSTMERALNERDLDTIVANVHEDVVFTTMNGDVVRGPEAIREYFTKMMEGDDRIVNSIRSSFEADDLSLLHGGDTAVAFGHSNDRYELASGDTFEVQARWSATMVRRDGRWLIANFHYSTNMFDNPVLEAQRSILLMILAGVGFATLLVGGGLGWFLGKRKKK